MSDIAQSTREYTLEFGDDSTLEVAVSIAISTENHNSIASTKLDNLSLSFMVDSINKAILDLLHLDNDSEDEESEPESIGPDQEEAE
jgi:hypothetical protein